MAYFDIQRKNHYFVNTLCKEISKFDVVSFSIFDTAVLQEVLYPNDLLRLLARNAEKEYGIIDFHYIRGNIENEIRINSGLEDISLNKIYEELSIRHPTWPIKQLRLYELQLLQKICHANPLIQQLYEHAVLSNKTICFISDTIYPSSVIESILTKCGYCNFSRIYCSGDFGKVKKSSGLFQVALADMGIEANHWLHIGSDAQADALVPRQLGITAATYHCPRERFWNERQLHLQEHEKYIDRTLPEEQLDNSLESSQRIAREINDVYTTILPPCREEVITVDHVSMMFNMSSEKVDNIKEYVIRLLKRQLMFQEFWALKDVSFSVARGEKVGLIGLNGSGKSTMLKIVSGVMKPTKGRVLVRGSIAPLIELGAGFDYELSARENVYLNGAILGYSHETMDAYYSEIINFAELQDFQDVAIKNFSSGMVARLGFAIATCQVPDILIIDEILSVGDFAFQQKCHDRMRQLTQRGATVLFVSHSSADIIEMCDRAIWLDHGQLIAEGEAQYIVEKYLNN